MMNKNTQTEFQFQDLFRRKVLARFDAEHVSSDGGLPLLREVANRTGILRDFARCFRDFRREDLIEHTVLELVSQRVFGIICGYEDLNDHATLSKDPLLSAICEKRDVEGKKRTRKQDNGKPLASPSTLNRLELTPADADESARYKKVVYDKEAIEDLFVDIFLKLHREPQKEIILDLDATDDPIHGNQEGRFFHGYYGHYCFLPLYIFCDGHLLLAKLRSSNIDACLGAKDEVERIIERIREKWPNVRIILRADSGFARDDLMSFCEDHHIDSLFGLARNHRLETMIQADLEEAKRLSTETGKPERVFRELVYETLKTWSRPRRVVAKAEHLVDKSNPRFVVTSIQESEIEAKDLYEKLYCARGDMENRIKEQQLALFADRTSANTMRANQLRLWFSSIAYILMHALRLFGLKGTELENAQCDTIRLRLIKIGALVKVSVRRILLRLSAASPVQRLFRQVLDNLALGLPNTA